MSEPRGPSQKGLFATLGVGALAVLCCAGPALLAGGALSGLGGALRNPWLITAGAVLVVAALGYTLTRRTRRRGAHACCPPTARPGACRPPTSRTQAESDHQSTKRPVDIEKRTAR